MKSLEQLDISGELPSPKGVALAILETCRKDDATSAEIARIAQTDPALTGRLIRQANTAAGGSGRPVASVGDAILRLGLTAVRNLAMAFSLVDHYQNGPCAAFDYQTFWSQSLLTAVAMQKLCTMTHAGSADELFACGLLSRIGCLALATAYPQAYAAVLQDTSSKYALAEREQQHLETNHNELTAALLAAWGIPAALIGPVYHREAPSRSSFVSGSRADQLTQLFNLASCIAELGIAPESDRNTRTAELLLLGSRIGLNADELGSAIDDMFRRWQEWGELLKVPASALPPFAQLSAVHAPRPEEHGTPAALRVLLVEDDPATRFTLENALGKVLGHSVICAGNGHEALALAVEALPQIVITDWMMPGMSGLELSRALRATEWGQAMYVIMLTSRDAEEEITEAFEIGVDDYLTKPVNIRTLRARLRAAWHYVQLLEAWERDRAQLRQFTAELAISNRRLEHAAMTDLLTSLPNRRSGMNALAKAWSGAERSSQPLSVLLFDVDHFKRINDTRGHAAGDHVLREIALALKNSARKNESVCRLGGEEFLMICEGSDIRAAVLAGERLRRVVEALRIDYDGRTIQCSISIGVAVRESTMADGDALVNAADRALYEAKQTGRNRTCAHFRGKFRCNPH
ncbi:HDOD domain-containing protein [Thauera sp. UPWRP]|nr:HDOD domain-containing protein [Thauera sp. UPWRP]